MKTAIAAAVALFAGLALAGSARADIAIGIAGPMTGMFALFGEQMKQGAEKAIADINAAGGVLGEPLVLEIGDDGCDGEKAVAVANQMVGRNIALMAGHLCSIASIHASPVYADASIVQISPASQSTRYTDERPGPGTLRISPRDDKQGRVAGAFLAQQFPDRNIAIVNDRSNYGKTLADATRAAMNAAGKTEVLNEAYDIAEKDFSSLVSKLKAARIDVVYIGGYHTEAALIARQIRAQDMDTLIVGSDALMTEEYWQAAGEAGEGTLLTFTPDPRKDPANAALVEAFRRADIEPEGYVLNTYAAIQTWRQAVEAAGTTDFGAVVAQLGTGDFETVLGAFTFDDKGDVTMPGYVVYQWKNGRYDYF